MTFPLPVIITPNAADDLTVSWTYLRDRNPRAADEWLAIALSWTWSWARKTGVPVAKEVGTVAGGAALAAGTVAASATAKASATKRAGFVRRRPSRWSGFGIAAR
jgi:hypothetical protein